MSRSTISLVVLILTGIAACGSRTPLLDAKPGADHTTSDARGLDLVIRDRNADNDARTRDRTSHADLCPSSLTYCGTTCVDLMSSQDDCGACGTKCPVGLICVKGGCGCAGTETACGTPPKCVTTASDTDNCGTCGKKCSGGKICVFAKCTCPKSLVECAGTCVDILTDAKNCGVCGHQCSPGDLCQGGACPNVLVQLQVSCHATTLPVAGTTKCTALRVLQSGATIDITNDPQTTWLSAPDPGSPAGCAGLTVGYFSTTTSGEFHVANNPSLAALGCRAWVQAAFIMMSSNKVTITVK